MFVKITKSGNGKFSYVKLVEGYRDEKGRVRHRTVKTLGRLDELTANDPDYLENLKQQFGSERASKKQAVAALRAQTAEAVAQVLGQSESPAEDFPLLRYGHYALKQIWNKTLCLPRKFDYLQSELNQKVQFSFNAAASFMIFRKAMRPSSVLAGFHDQDEYLGAPLQGISLQACYRTLDFLKENKDEIFNWVNRQMDKHYGTDRATLVFYDVTNAYFEAPLTDAEMENYHQDFLDKLQATAEQARAEKELPEACFDDDGSVLPDTLPQDFIDAVADDHNPEFLRMRGPSKEHRSDLPLVSIALVIDKNGFPMDFEVFKGNSSEYRTMESAIRKLKDKYNIGHAIVVADRGLNSAENLLMLQRLELGYLVAQKVSNLKDETLKQMLDLSAYQSINDKDPESNKYRVIEDWERTGKSGSVKCSLVLTWSEKRKRRDEKLLEIWADLIRKRSGQELKTRKPAWAGIATTDTKEKKQVITGIDESALAERKALCGFAAVVYDEYCIERTEMADEQETKARGAASGAEVNQPVDKGERILKTGKEIASMYHCLNQIETCFRIMKSNIGLRPMYVWTSSHIYGHITACVLALLLLRLLQDKLKKQGTPISIDTLCRELHDSTVMAQIIDDNQITFYRCGFGPKLRKGNELLTEEELGAQYVAGKARNHKADILQACGLSLPPRVCSRPELASCLGTRFPTNRSAVPMLRELGQR